MNKFQISILLIFLVSCFDSNSSKQKENESVPDSLMVTIKPTKYYQVEEATQSDFEEAKKNYKEEFDISSPKITKIDKTLRIPISNGSYKEYIDTLIDNEIMNASCRLFEYLGYNLKYDFYLIDVSFHEYESFYLINAKNGKELILSGKPKFSLKGNYLATININGGMGEEPIGFILYKFDSKKQSLQSIENEEQYEYYPIDFVWESENSVLVKVISMKSQEVNDENKIENSKDCVYKRLKIL